MRFLAVLKPAITNCIWKFTTSDHRKKTALFVNWGSTKILLLYAVVGVKKNKQKKTQHLSAHNRLILTTMD